VVRAKLGRWLSAKRPQKDQPRVLLKFPTKVTLAVLMNLVGHSLVIAGWSLRLALGGHAVLAPPQIGTLRWCSQGSATAVCTKE